MAEQHTTLDNTENESKKPYADEACKDLIKFLEMAKTNRKAKKALQKVIDERQILIDSEFGANKGFVMFLNKSLAALL